MQSRQMIWKQWEHVAYDTSKLFWRTMGFAESSGERKFSSHMRSAARLFPVQIGELRPSHEAHLTAKRSPPCNGQDVEHRRKARLI